MSAEPNHIQVTWEDPTTGELRQPVLVAPVAIGREQDQMPDQIGSQSVSRLTLPHRQVSRFHALITVSNGQLYVTDRSANGTFLNGQLLRQGSQPISSKDTLRIGPYKITASRVRSQELDVITELTVHDYTQITRTASPMAKNTLLIWAMGIVVMLTMCVGALVSVRLLLERSRPQPSSPTSMAPEVSHSLATAHPGPLQHGLPL